MDAAVQKDQLRVVTSPVVNDLRIVVEALQTRLVRSRQCLPAQVLADADAILPMAYDTLDGKELVVAADVLAFGTVILADANGTAASCKP